MKLTEIKSQIENQKPVAYLAYTSSGYAVYQAEISVGSTEEIIEFRIPVEKAAEKEFTDIPAIELLDNITSHDEYVSSLINL